VIRNSLLTEKKHRVSGVSLLKEDKWRMIRVRRRKDITKVKRMAGLNESYQR
jgi:hypothetical protein